MKIYIHSTYSDCTLFFKALNIPRSFVKLIIKRWKEYGTWANLPRTACPHKLTARGTTETTKTPVTSLKELQLQQVKWERQHTAQCCSRQDQIVHQQFLLFCSFFIFSPSLQQPEAQKHFTMESSTCHALLCWNHNYVY